MAEPGIYLVLDAEGNVINAIVWDGETEWSPGQNREVIARSSLPERAKNIGIGWQRKPDNNWEDKRPVKDPTDFPQ